MTSQAVKDVNIAMEDDKGRTILTAKAIRKKPRKRVYGIATSCIRRVRAYSHTHIYESVSRTKVWKYLATRAGGCHTCIAVMKSNANASDADANLREGARSAKVNEPSCCRCRVVIGDGAQDEAVLLARLAGRDAGPARACPRRHPARGRRESHCAWPVA